MRRGIVIAVAVLVVFVVTIPLWTRFVPDELLYRADFERARVAIDRIEKYQQANGRLPNNLTDIGIAESEAGPLYYQLSDPDGYMLWFKAPTYGFFGVLTFDSQTGTWTGSD